MVGLGSSGVGIGLSVTLIDRFSLAAGNVARSMVAMSTSIDKGMMSNLRTARRWGVGMAVVGGLGLRAMGKAHGAFRDFDWEMTTVAAVTSKTTEELKSLDTIVKNLAQRSIFNPQEIASATTRLAKAGFEVRQIEEAMAGVVMLGTATDTNVGGKSGVADMMSKIMRSFDLPANTTMHVADVITKAVNSAAMDMDDAFEALKFLGNTAHIMGLELEDAMAMVGVLANAGVPQGIAGRGLVNSLFKMAKSVGSMATTGDKQSLATLGLRPSDIKDAKGNLLPIVDIIDKLMLKVKGMGNTDVVSALAKWMRIRGGRAIMPLIQEFSGSGAKTFREFREMLANDSSGEALRVSQQRMASAEGVFRVMNDVWDTLKVTWGEAIDQVLTPFFKWLSDVMRKMIEFVKTPIGKWLAIALTGFLALVTVLGIITVLVTSVTMLFSQMGTMFGPMIARMVSGWGAAATAAATYGTAVRAAAVSNGALATSTGFRGAGTAWVTASGLAGPGMAYGGASIVKGRGVLAMLGRGFGAFVRFLGPLGMIVGILGMIIGWKELLKGIVTIIGTITNVIRLLFDVIMGLFTGKVGAAFEKFADNQSSLGTKGMFADPNATKEKELYKSRAEYWLKSVQPRREKAMHAYQNDPLSLANRQEIKLAMENNIIVGDDVVQKQVAYYTTKEMNDILN